MTQSERLNILIDELKIDGKRLAEALSLTGSAISDWRSGKASLRKTNCLALQALYGVSWRWLLDGDGPMWAASAEGRQGQPGDLIYVPRIQGAASCGPGGDIMDPGAAAPRTPFELSLLQEILHECGAGIITDLYLVESTGESMRPTIIPGDQILINAALPLRLNPKRGGLFLVRMDPLSGDGRIKRIGPNANGHLLLASDAPGFASIEVDVNGVPIQSLVLGRVCWIARTVVRSEQADRNW